MLKEEDGDHASCVTWQASGVSYTLVWRALYTSAQAQRLNAIHYRSESDVLQLRCTLYSMDMQCCALCKPDRELTPLWSYWVVIAAGGVKWNCGEQE